MQQSQCLQSFEIDRLLMALSMAYGVRKALFITKRWKERKKKPWKSGLHMIQDPLEEGGVVKPSVCMHILFSGMG